MQQAFKTMMGQMGSQNNQFGNAPFSPGSPFPYQPPPTSGPSTSSGFTFQQPSTYGLSGSSASSASAPNQATSPSAASEATVSVDVSTTETESQGPAKDESEIKTEVKRSGIITIPLSGF